MDQNSNRSAKGRKGDDSQPPTPLLPLSPVNVRSSDPGDATARNFRYQHAYGAMLLIAARCGDFPYVAIWCESARPCGGLQDPVEIVAGPARAGSQKVRQSQ